MRSSGSLEYQKYILQVKLFSHCRNKNFTTVFENPQLNSILNQFSTQLLISSHRRPSYWTHHNQLYMTTSLTACIIFPRPTDTPLPLISSSQRQHVHSAIYETQFLIFPSSCFIPFRMPTHSPRHFAFKHLQSTIKH